MRRTKETEQTLAMDVISEVKKQRNRWRAACIITTVIAAAEALALIRIGK